jgi:hypothetical protein
MLLRTAMLTDSTHTEAVYLHSIDVLLLLSTLICCNEQPSVASKALLQRRLAQRQEMQNAALYLAAVVLHTVRQPLCKRSVAADATAAKSNAASASNTNVSSITASNTHTKIRLVVLLSLYTVMRQRNRDYVLLAIFACS